MLFKISLRGELILPVSKYNVIIISIILNIMKKGSKGKRVLIVDDEKPMAQALELKLNKLNFQAKAVFNGEGFKKCPKL